MEQEANLDMQPSFRQRNQTFSDSLNSQQLMQAKINLETSQDDQEIDHNANNEPAIKPPLQNNQMEVEAVNDSQPTNNFSAEQSRPTNIQDKTGLIVVAKA